LALTLSACAPHAPPTVAAKAPIIVPDELRSCPLTPSPIPVPKPPRTTASVVAWANATEEQRTKTVQALEVCRKKLVDLLALVDRAQP
jgi:hypothetical protein